MTPEQQADRIRRMRAAQAPRRPMSLSTRESIASKMRSWWASLPAEDRARRVEAFQGGQRARREFVSTYLGSEDAKTMRLDNRDAQLAWLAKQTPAKQKAVAVRKARARRAKEAAA